MGKGIEEMEMSLSVMVLDFFEELERGGEKERNNGWETGDEDDGSVGDAMKDKDFWEAQSQLLHEALGKYSATENMIRMKTEEAVRKFKSGNSTCSCSNRTSATEYCRNCMLSQITELLRQAGYNSAFCKSKWRRSTEIPSGEHSYIDVVVEFKNYNKKPIRFVIELNFRAEFEMARASNEYRKLVNTLPELFVGKSEKLRNVIKVMCESAKKCMKENKMYMAPWRKHEYMQSKWMVTAERLVPEISVPVPMMKAVPNPEMRSKLRRESLLTSDLHCTAIEVV
ncbi:DUF506 family protein (DUF506) [Rhynchospora pubera]|uniref:DUF506 family protein (DUF506) n=1 Tax=Rhynchospora pubera TaxID=906938 RepID=A0AAV8G2R6_9POAL|nr:DUF506 family protein (DUF506) [Rhynchospora pubera]